MTNDSEGERGPSLSLVFGRLILMIIIVVRMKPQPGLPHGSLRHIQSSNLNLILSILVEKSVTQKRATT